MQSSDPHVLRIAYLPDGGFVLPILSRLQSSGHPELRAVVSIWVDSGLGDLACSVSTKASMLSAAAGRLSGSVRDLLVSVVGDPHSQDALAAGKGWVPAQRQQPYRVLLDVEAFLYEARSLYEILGKFLVRFFDVILHHKLKETKIVAELRMRGVDMSWADDLSRYRKLFFHEQAPWLAVYAPASGLSAYDVLVLPSSNTDPGDKQKVLPLNRLAAMYTGMDNSLRHLQDWIDAEISKRETETSRPSA